MTQSQIQSGGYKSPGLSSSINSPVETPSKAEIETETKVSFTLQKESWDFSKRPAQAFYYGEAKVHSRVDASKAFNIIQLMAGLGYQLKSIVVHD